MKKISYYLIIIVAIGVILGSFWAYQRYFKKEKTKFLSFKVERGNIQEAVKVRGEVVSQKNFNLEFPFSGIVKKIFVKEGQNVDSGAPLIKLETIDFELEIRKYQAGLAEAKANLATQQAKLTELENGTRPEAIKVQEVIVANAETALGDAQQTLTDKLQDSYTKSDDAVRNRVDQFFDNPRSSNPKLLFTVPAGSQLKVDVEWERTIVENILIKWKISLDNLDTEGGFDEYIKITKDNLNQIKSFLDKTALAVNGVVQSSSISKATIDGWRSNVAIARTNMNIAIINFTAAEEKLKTAKSNLALVKQELILKQAGATKEQIIAQEAQVEQAKASMQSYQAQIAIVQEKIRKSTLYAPVSSKIVKVQFEKQELFKPGNIAVTLETSGHKVQADISELDIGKIKSIDKNNVLIQPDAFPGMNIEGKVISVEPKEIIKDGDKYYRVNIYMETHSDEIRPGMNVDLTIAVSSKENVLKIPELAIYKKDNKEFVTIVSKNGSRKVKIETGISDGESIEVVKGLEEGQTVIVSED